MIISRTSVWWSGLTWTSPPGSMSAFGHQPSFGCQRWDLFLVRIDLHILFVCLAMHTMHCTGELCKPWEGGGAWSSRQRGRAQGSRWQNGDYHLRCKFVCCLAWNKFHWFHAKWLTRQPTQLGLTRRLRVTLSCDFDLALFPHDAQASNLFF